MDADWGAAAGHPSLKRAGDELRGPCPVTNSGTDAFWINPARKLVGCRKCSSGSGGLSGPQFSEHLSALGIGKQDMPPAARPKRAQSATPIETWTWTAADGTERRMNRWQTGKRWEKTKPDNTPPPADLLYIPRPLDGDGPPVVVTEGPGDADAAVAAGMPAVGHPSLHNPSASSLARLPKKRKYLVVPDLDTPGRRQAAAWTREMRAVGLDAASVDMRKLAPEDAPRGWDLRDWLKGLGDGVEPLELLEEAVEEDEQKVFSEEPIVNEERLGQEFLRQRMGSLLLLEESGDWMEWNEGRWNTLPEDCVTARVMTLGTRAFVRAGKKGEYVPSPAAGGRLSTARGAVKWMRGFLPLRTSQAAWDADTTLVGLPGPLVLQIGADGMRTMKRTREMLVRRELGCVPAPGGDWRAGQWGEHLAQAFDGQPDVAQYLQRVIGMAVAGRRHDRFLVATGKGGGRKSTTFNPILKAMGTYGSSPPPESITATRGMQVHPVRRIGFLGARLALVSEIEPGAYLDSSFVKALTGGGKINARRMGENDTSFEFRGLLVIETNFAPRQLSPDTGVMRRILMIRFENLLPASAQVAGFRDSMPVEDVLAWILEGARNYLRDGLGETPKRMEEIVNEYASAADPVSMFLEEECVLNPDAFTTKKDLYYRYRKWGEDEGHDGRLPRTRLVTRLVEGVPGLTEHRTGRARGIRGLELRTDTEAAAEEGYTPFHG